MFSFIVITNKLTIDRTEPQCTVCVGKDLTFRCFICLISLTVCRNESSSNLCYPIPSSSCYNWLSRQIPARLPQCQSFNIRCAKDGVREDQINSSESSRDFLNIYEQTILVTLWRYWGISVSNTRCLTSSSLGDEPYFTLPVLFLLEKLRWTAQM